MSVNYNADMLDKLHKLFEVATEFCMESGGDGDVWIVSEKYVALADHFDTWRKGRDINGGDLFDIRYNVDDGVAFMMKPEDHILFVKSRDCLPESWLGDLVVESSHLQHVITRDA